MVEIKVKEIMSSKVITIPKDLPVREVARMFIKKKIGGAPVVDEKGKVVGMITENDLIMQDIKIHFPTYIHLLMAFFTSAV